MNAISMETMLAHSPYTTDTMQEMERIKAEEDSNPVEVMQVVKQEEEEGATTLVE